MSAADTATELSLALWAPTGDNRMARELVEFALESDGQQVVEAHGFISQRVAPQRDLRRVTDYLAQAEDRSRQVLLFGFNDARGSPEQNLRLSQQRA